MKLNSFIVKVKNNKLVFKSPEHIKMFDRWVGQYNDQEIRLTIDEMKSKRSDEQNRYYWLYLGYVSEDTGFTTEELHEWAKGKFLTKQISYISFNDNKPDPVRVRASTTKMTKGEFVEFLMKIENETGIPLPDTREYLGYSYHK